MGGRSDLRINYTVPQGTYTCGLAKFIDEHLAQKEGLQAKTQMAWA